MRTFSSAWERIGHEKYKRLYHVTYIHTVRENNTTIHVHVGVSRDFLLNTRAAGHRDLYIPSVASFLARRNRHAVLRAIRALHADGLAWLATWRNLDLDRRCGIQLWPSPRPRCGRRAFPRDIAPACVRGRSGHHRGRRATKEKCPCCRNLGCRCLCQSWRRCRCSSGRRCSIKEPLSCLSHLRVTHGLLPQPIARRIQLRSRCPLGRCSPFRGGGSPFGNRAQIRGRGSSSRSVGRSGLACWRLVHAPWGGGEGVTTRYGGLHTVGRRLADASWQRQPPSLHLHRTSDTTRGLDSSRHPRSANTLGGAGQLRCAVRKQRRWQGQPWPTLLRRRQLLCLLQFYLTRGRQATTRITAAEVSTGACSGVMRSLTQLQAALLGWFNVNHAWRWWLTRERCGARSTQPLHCALELRARRSRVTWHHAKAYD